MNQQTFVATMKIQIEGKGIVNVFKKYPTTNISGSIVWINMLVEDSLEAALPNHFKPNLFIRILLNSFVILLLP